MASLDPKQFPLQQNVCFITTTFPPSAHRSSPSLLLAIAAPEINPPCPSLLDPSKSAFLPRGPASASTHHQSPTTVALRSATTMFYRGTLQEGISTAVGQQKLSGQALTPPGHQDENDESQTWENEFLQDESLKDVIAKRAVALRLAAGSEEAGYLAQIFPLPQTPTVVIMKHGELKEYIAAGTTKEEFLRRVQNAFEIPHVPSQPSAAENALPYSSSPAADAAATQAGTSGPAGVPSATVAQSDNVRRVLQDRAAKAKQEAAERAAEKKAADDDELARKQKQQADKDAEAGKSAQKQAELVKKKKQQESDERKRILKRIQDDKEERRKRAQEQELRRMERRSQTNAQTQAQTQSQSQSRRSSSTRLGEHTSIQVRLFDGSTIRSRFKTASPVKHVRQWIDEARTDGSMPYALKQLLTPLPNRPIDDTEDEKSLGDVGLSPSSTLILVPIQTYAAAYGDPSQGIFSRLVGMIWGIFTWLFGSLNRGDGGGGDDDDDHESSSARSTTSAAAQSKDARVRGFQHPDDRRRDHQLYNGNSLNFEPRPDEDDER
ncbi:hypothetical protein E4U42_001108 [Claviceps africana]|uniref:UBX domain-containing protein n=1 Tax=Claviceps africana TaxID=83212 RepID=A0A8K0J9V9_9HYPO|nr:hypothetical protein E4U42_001108 [Claviceps africana]